MLVVLPAGLVMIDTGCKRAVGGRPWHVELQKTLDAKGVPCHSINQQEYFKFGPGVPLMSERA
eukprot:3046023-Pyramimonas_sp.AAC.1